MKVVGRRPRWQIRPTCRRWHALDCDSIARRIWQVRERVAPSEAALRTWSVVCSFAHLQQKGEVLPRLVFSERYTVDWLQVKGALARRSILVVAARHTKLSPARPRACGTRTNHWILELRSPGPQGMLAPNDHNSTCGNLKQQRSADVGQKVQGGHGCITRRPCSVDRGVWLLRGSRAGSRLAAKLASSNAATDFWRIAIGGLPGACRLLGCTAAPETTLTVWACADQVRGQPKGGRCFSGDFDWRSANEGRCRDGRARSQPRDRPDTTGPSSPLDPDRHTACPAMENSHRETTTQHCTARGRCMYGSAHSLWPRVLEVAELCTARGPKGMGQAQVAAAVD